MCVFILRMHFHLLGVSSNLYSTFNIYLPHDHIKVKHRFISFAVPFHRLSQELALKCMLYFHAVVADGHRHLNGEIETNERFIGKFDVNIF